MPSSVEVTATQVNPQAFGVPSAGNNFLPSNGRNFAQLSQVNTSIINQAAQNATQVGAKDAGDYFEYALKEKITIGKNQSALVPILSARVEAEKVSLWNENDQQHLRALWLKNC